VARPEDDGVALSRYIIDPTHEETDRTFVLDGRRD
jgi:hypothetical protein